MLVESVENKKLFNGIKEEYFHYSILAIGLSLIYIGLAELYFGITWFYSSYSILMFGASLLLFSNLYKRLNIPVNYLAIGIVLITTPYLAFRILTTNGFNGSSAIWYIVIYMYAHLFVSSKFFKFTLFYSALIIAFNIFVEYQYQDFWSYYHFNYPYILSMQLTIINIAHLGFHIVLYQILEKRMQQKLKFQEEVIQNTSKLALAGELTGNIAHEINTPLGTIQLMVESLKRKLPATKDNQDIHEDLNVIKKVSDRIHKIITSTLRYYGNAAVSEMEDINLIELLVSVEEICKNKVLRYNIEMITENQLSPNTAIHCCPHEIEQCLINLVNNAADAVKNTEEKWVKIKTYEDETNIFIEIIDSGLTIKPKTRKKMFIPYYTTKAVGKGTGIGLPMVAKLVEKNEGSILYLPNRKNTTFSLKLKKT